MYLLMNIGCIECGVESKVVGVFRGKDEAEKLAVRLNNDRKFSWRQGGQNSYEVHALADVGVIDQEYV